MSDAMNMHPMHPIDYLAILILFLMIALVVLAIKKAWAEKAELSAAYELVDTTFAISWDCDRNLELYAWTVTKAKLHGNSNPFVNEVISQRLREYHRKRKARQNVKTQHVASPKKGKPVFAINPSDLSPQISQIPKPTI